MNEKCSSHDDCFKRLYEKVEKMDEKLDRIVEGLRDRLHAGDLRFEKIELRIGQCEKILSENSSEKFTVRTKLISTAIDLLKLAAIGIGSAAAWAFANGYQG